MSGGTVTSPDRDHIKTFVQQILGCKCPDAILDNVEIERDILTDSGVYLHSRINVSNRLLIYVIEQKRSAFTPNDLQGIVHEGIHDRYKYGFSRFRLVLATDGSEELHKSIVSKFDTLPDRDDKVHLHIIGKEDLTF
jgi:hypothetical protein